MILFDLTLNQRPLLNKEANFIVIKRNLSLTELKERIKKLHAAGYVKVPRSGMYRKVWRERVGGNDLQLAYGLSNFDITLAMVKIEHLLEYAQRSAMEKLYEAKRDLLNPLSKGEMKQ